MSATLAHPARPVRRSASASWLFVLTLIGYPAVGLQASLLNLDSMLLSIPFRIAVALLAVWVLVRARPNASQLWRPRWLFVFWLAYLVRLLWDLLVARIPGSSEALVFFLLTVLLPCTALGLAAPRLDERRTATLLLAFGAAVCATAVLMQVSGLGAARSTTEQLDGRLSFEAVNPITLGNVAATTLIAALCLTQRHPRPLEWLALFAAAAVAGVCLMLAASRGPLLSLAFATIVFAAITGRWRWLALLVLLGLALVLDPDSELFTRFATIQEDESALLRLAAQANAITQFLDHPLLGSAFVELEFLEYPHNLFIETAMAVGIAGSVLLLTLLYKSLVGLRQVVRRGGLLLPLLFVQVFIGAQLSGGIWSNGPLWACVALLLGLSRGQVLGRTRGRLSAQAPQPHPTLSAPGAAPTL